MRLTVRKATPGDAAALAGLRLGRLSEKDGRDDVDRSAFVASFTAWVADHMQTHLPFVAEVDGEAVGMAWLMVAERVPSGTRPYRRCGDVQSVFVDPGMRDAGIGAALMEAVLAEADRLGLEHVTVHSSHRAVPFYRRAGFGYDRTWLRWEPE